MIPQTALFFHNFRLKKPKFPTSGNTEKTKIVRQQGLCVVLHLTSSSSRMSSSSILSVSEKVLRRLEFSAAAVEPDPPVVLVSNAAEPEYFFRCSGVERPLSSSLLFCLLALAKSCFFRASR